MGASSTYITTTFRVPHAPSEHSSGTSTVGLAGLPTGPRHTVHRDLYRFLWVARPGLETDGNS